MKEYTVPHLEEQEKVNAYFHSRSSYWKELYSRQGVFSETIRDRQAAVLNWIDSLALAPGSQVLEIGCGAGFLAVALAQRGLRICAIDSAEAMVELARQHAAECEVTDMLSVTAGDVYVLAFEDDSFDLVIALGVIPWLERVEPAIQEMARVTRPGGHVILTTANRVGLVNLLDPLVNPALSPLKQGVKSVLEWIGLRRRSQSQSPDMIFHSSRFINKTLARAGLVKTASMTRGFGFSLFRRRVLPIPLGVALHHRLQRLADRNVPVLRSAGMAYFVLAKKK